MQPLKARVRKGRLILDEPTDLPEGNLIELFSRDQVLERGGDFLDDDERAALHRELEASILEADRVKPKASRRSLPSCVGTGDLGDPCSSRSRAAHDNKSRGYRRGGPIIGQLRGRCSSTSSRRPSRCCAPTQSLALSYTVQRPGTIRRLLLGKTEYHLYYRYIAHLHKLVVLAVWGAPGDILQGHQVPAAICCGSPRCGELP